MSKIARPFYEAEPALVGQRFGVNPNPIQLNGHTGIDVVPDNIYLPQWLVAPEKCRVSNIVNNLNLQSNSDEELRRGYGILLESLVVRGRTFLYWHCEPVFPVRTNDVVEMGQIVAMMGNSGYVLWGGTYVQISERLKPYRPGKHLHFEVKQDGKFVDPMPLIDWTLPVESKRTSFDEILSILRQMSEVLKGH